MQTNANAKFQEGEIAQKWHNSKILNDDADGLKFPSFERDKIAWKSCCNGLLGTKKALFRSAHSTQEKGAAWPPFSVKCKKLVLSSGRQEVCLGCPNPYFWRQSRVVCQ